MRQGALIVLLAHVGSFVPAERAVLGPIDRIFTRIGAGDDLAGGRSTFMVEMTEAANILNNATDKSLILMDEIGRGTSTFDGLSLAWAVARHIARVNRSFTLFATHYFELTNLANEIDGCANVHLDATEHRDGIVFLHAVKEGPASRSYGLAVAQLAGVPREVIAAAREYLAALETGGTRTTAAPQAPDTRGRAAGAPRTHAPGPTTARAAGPSAGRPASAGARSRAARGQRRRPHADGRARPDLQAALAARLTTNPGRHDTAICDRYLGSVASPRKLDGPTGSCIRSGPVSGRRRTMFAAKSRARVCALILVIAAPFAPAQTVELITGQGRFVDIPGNTLGFQAGSMAVGPDGLLYLTDINKRLMRVNPATGTVTALPATSGGLNFEVGNNGFVFNAAGQLFTPLNGQLTRINPETGEKTPLGEFYYGGPMAFHPNGKLYFAPGDNKVYERLPSGAVNVIAGVGEESGFSGDGGPAVDAQLSYLQDMKLGPDGNIYVADTENNRIRRISLTTGIITTVAGTGLAEFNGDGLHATETNFPSPLGLAFDPAGNLYAGGIGDYRIRRIDAVTGIVTTVAGTGVHGMSGDGIPAVEAGVGVAEMLAFDNLGNLYFADSTQYYKYIRKIDAATGNVTSSGRDGKHLALRRRRAGALWLPPRLASPRCRQHWKPAVQRK